MLARIKSQSGLEPDAVTWWSSRNSRQTVCRCNLWTRDYNTHAWGRAGCVLEGARDGKQPADVSARPIALQPLADGGPYITASQPCRV